MGQMHEDNASDKTREAAGWVPQFRDEDGGKPPPDNFPVDEPGAGETAGTPPTRIGVYEPVPSIDGITPTRAGKWSPLRATARQGNQWIRWLRLIGVPAEFDHRTLDSGRTAFVHMAPLTTILGIRLKPAHSAKKLSPMRVRVTNAANSVKAFRWQMILNPALSAPPAAFITDPAASFAEYSRENLDVSVDGNDYPDGAAVVIAGGVAFQEYTEIVKADVLGAGELWIAVDGLGNNANVFASITFEVNP